MTSFCSVATPKEKHSSAGVGRFVVYAQDDCCFEYPGEVRISGNARQRRAVVRSLMRRGYFLTPGGVAR